MKILSSYLYRLAVDLASIGDQFWKRIYQMYLLGSLRNMYLTYVGASELMPPNSNVVDKYNWFGLSLSSMLSEMFLLCHILIVCVPKQCCNIKAMLSEKNKLGHYNSDY